MKGEEFLILANPVIEAVFPALEKLYNSAGVGALSGYEGVTF